TVGDMRETSDSCSWAALSTGKTFFKPMAQPLLSPVLVTPGPGLINPRSFLESDERSSAMPNAVTGPQTINIDSTGKLVSVTASVQSAGTQSVQITDSTGKVVYSASGKSSSGGTFTWLTPGTFTSGGTGNYTVTLTSGAGILPGENDIVYQ